MDNVFELKEPREGATHIKIISYMDQTDNSKVIGDLGIIEEDEFVVLYGNAVIPNIDVKNLIIPQNPGVQDE